MIIQEATSIIYVDRNKELNKVSIRYALMSAQATCHYAKFVCGRYYISVLFNRDLTVSISTNYRNNSRFTNEIYWLDRNKYQLATYTDFIYRWLNYFRTVPNF